MSFYSDPDSYRKKKLNFICLIATKSKAKKVAGVDTFCFAKN